MEMPVIMFDKKDQYLVLTVEQVRHTFFCTFSFSCATATGT